MKKLTLLFFLLASPSAAQPEFSQENAAALLKKLSVEIGPRPMGSPAEQQALRFAVVKFKEYGCDTTYIMRFDRTKRANTASGIAVGVKKGMTKRIIVIGGHIDSSGPEIPGADDNGSGSAVVMELARVFGRKIMQSTLVFTCFGGEEQGLEGSKFFADHFSEIDSVMLMVNIDMANGLGIINIDGDSHGQSAPPWLIRAAVEEFHKLGYENLRYPTHAFVLNYSGPAGAGSDHASFLRKGIPSVDFTTDPRRPIHTPQDHFQNFDPRGLKRSGDLVLSLVERFDGGVPNKELTTYWLYGIGNNFIFVPYWAIAIFLLFVAACSVIVFIAVRKRRIYPVDIRWSGIKMLLYTIVIVLFGWISPDIIGWIKGYRYVWMTDVPLYYVNAGVFTALGIWLSLWITRKLRLSQCPYVFYKRASIILIVFTGLFAWGNLELAIYPASALLFLSVAILMRNTVLKFAFALLSPLWMIRLAFNEWDEFFFRIIASGGISTGDFPQNLFYNGSMILFFSLYLYPLFLGFASVYRDSKNPQRFLTRLRSPWGGIGIAALIAALIAYLYPREVYSALWYRNVFVEQEYRPANDSSGAGSNGSIRFRSAEYLDGIRIIRDRGDTVLTGKFLSALIPVGENNDNPSWVHVERDERRVKTGDTTDFAVDLTISCIRRPFTVSVTYSSGTNELGNFSSTKLFTTGGKPISKTLHWYSFPDSVMTIPMQFQTVGGDSVKERIEVVFNLLAHPTQLEREKTNFFLRTKFYDSKVYKSN